MIKLEIFTSEGPHFIDPIDVKRITPTVDPDGCIVRLYDGEVIVSTDKSTELYDELLEALNTNARAAAGMTIYEQLKADSPGLFTTLPDDVTTPAEPTVHTRQHPSNPEWFSVPVKDVDARDTNSLPVLPVVPLSDTMEVSR